jgi:hypothetical protein
VAGRHTLVSTLVRLTMRYAARWPSPPALYFAALDFFLAAHRALAASDRRLRRAGDIDLFLAGTISLEPRSLRRSRCVQGSSLVRLPRARLAFS